MLCKVLCQFKSLWAELHVRSMAVKTLIELCGCVANTYKLMFFTGCSISDVTISRIATHDVTGGVCLGVGYLSTIVHERVDG